MDTVGKRIRALREAHDVTQKQLAKAVGLTGSAISELEHDRSKSTTVLHRIADHFGVSVHWLDTGTGSKYGVAEKKEAYAPTVRPMFKIMADAVMLLREYLEVRDEPSSWIADPTLLQFAYQVVEEHGRAVEQEDLMQLIKRLASLQRGSS